MERLVLVLHNCKESGKLAICIVADMLQQLVSTIKMGHRGH